MVAAQVIEASLLSSLQLRARQILLIQANSLQRLWLRDVHASEESHSLSIERLLCQVPSSVTFLNLKRHAGSQGIGAVSGQQLGCLRSLGQLKELALKFCVLTSSLLEDLNSLTRQSLSHSNHRHYNIYKLDSFSIYIYVSYVSTCMYMQSCTLFVFDLRSSSYTRKCKMVFGVNVIQAS